MVLSIFENRYCRFECCVAKFHCPVHLPAQSPASNFLGCTIYSYPLSFPRSTSQGCLTHLPGNLLLFFFSARLLLRRGFTLTITLRYGSAISMSCSVQPSQRMDIMKFGVFKLKVASSKSKPIHFGKHLSRTRVSFLNVVPSLVFNTVNVTNFFSVAQLLGTIRNRREESSTSVCLLSSPGMYML